MLSKNYEIIVQEKYETTLCYKTTKVCCFKCIKIWMRLFFVSTKFLTWIIFRCIKFRTGLILGQLWVPEL